MATIKDSIAYALDPDQRIAATAPEGPTAILAGPGAGKTHTLLGRIKVMLDSGADPSSITYLTFTSNAAEEARELGARTLAGQNITIASVTGYACAFLRDRGAKLMGYDASYTIWGDDQSQECARDLNEEKGQDDKFSIRELGQYFDWVRHKNNNYSRIPSDYRPQFNELYQAHQAAKRNQNALDLGELLPTAIMALEDYPEVRDQWVRTRSRHLFVDEFQDVNRTQLRFIELLVGRQQSITIAMDPNQAIYRWRGATKEVVEQFFLAFNKTKIYYLTQNHRSTAALTELGNALSADENLKGLTATNQIALVPSRSSAVTCTVPGSEPEKLTMIGEIIKEHLARGEAASTIAVLTNRNQTRNTIANELFTQKIPFTQLGDNRRLEEEEAQAMINMMRLALNPNDQQAFKRVAGQVYNGQRHNLNPHILAAVKLTAQEEHCTLIEAAEILHTDFENNTNAQRGLMKAIRNFRMLRNEMENPEIKVSDICTKAHQLRATEGGNKLTPSKGKDATNIITLAEAAEDDLDMPIEERIARFLEKHSIAAYPEHRNKENMNPLDHDEGVAVATIHAAKGRQWKTVLVADAYQAYMPGENKDPNRPKDQPAIEESQRLFYVASTRATDHLYYMIAETTEHRFTEFMEPIINLLEKKVAVPVGEAYRTNGSTETPSSN